MINLENIKPTSVSATVICLGLFFNIEFMIYTLNPKLFLNLDLIRLSAIGLGLTFPILIGSVVFMAAVKRHESNYEHEKEKNEYDTEWIEKQTWAGGGAIAIIIVSLVCLISHFFGYSLTRALWIIFWSYFGLVLLAIITGSSKRKRRH